MTSSDTGATVHAFCVVPCACLHDWRAGQISVSIVNAFIDVFGTVVDWRTTVTKQLNDRASEKLNAPSCSIKKSTRKACAKVSWRYFAQEWRDSYYAFIDDQAKKSTPPKPEHTTSFADPTYAPHVQTSISDPEAVEKMIRSNPILREGGLIAQQLMQDPDVIKSMMDPKAHANPQGYLSGGMGDSSDNDNPVAFKTVDDHHHDSLKDLLAKYRIDRLWTKGEVREISRIWHKLEPWSDSVDGLQAIKKRGLIVSALSYGNTTLLKDLKDHAKLPWSHIFSAEQFGVYKPNPAVYLGACERLGLEPGQCAMVSAHLSDLKAAKECGLQAIYIERPGEESWDAEQVQEAKESDWVTLWVGLDQKLVEGGILEVDRELRYRWLCSVD